MNIAQWQRLRRPEGSLADVQAATAEAQPTAAEVLAKLHALHLGMGSSEEAVGQPQLLKPPPGMSSWPQDVPRTVRLTSLAPGIQARLLQSTTTVSGPTVIRRQDTASALHRPRLAYTVV